MKIVSYVDQIKDWPQQGRHILAQFDSESIYVYQAYRPAIANFAVKNQRFGGEFSFSRMSWIKPNFLWMMYRAGWATKEGQEHILAVRLRREFFDELLKAVVPSSWDTRRFATRDDWQAAVAESEVRLQWDPDHDPVGKPLERRAVQLGLRSATLRRYGTEAIISIEDITPFVAAQREYAKDGFAQLQVPEEKIYRPKDEAAANAVGIEQGGVV